MKLGTLPRAAFALFAIALIVAPAHAGQVRVSVADNIFTPGPITINQGDLVAWVWTGVGVHSVRSGTPAAPTGLLSSGVASGLRFSSRPSSSTQYFCEPHLAAMSGNITVVASDHPVSSFRITEVQFNDPGGQDFVEIANLGDAPGNLGAYRLSVRAGTPLTLPLPSIVVAMGGRVVVWINRAGANSQTEIFFATEPELPRTGSAGLYAPNTTAAGSSLALPAQMIDFVQWGDIDQLNAVTAANASLWNGSEYVAAPAAPHPIEFCGNESQRGASFWNPRENATPGGSDCTTPTKSATWGRIKNAYR